MDNFRSIDIEQTPIPNEVEENKDRVSIQAGHKEIQKRRVFFREAVPPLGIQASGLSVLLLHGKWFSSRTWLDLGTIAYLAAMGHRTLAIDVPDYGNTDGPEIADELKPEFLRAVLESFELQNPVVVSPSMGGFYSLPYLVKHWDKLAGYVPVAPFGMEALEQLPCTTDPSCKERAPQELKHFLNDPIPELGFIQTPTLNVYGEHDRTRKSALLSLLPRCQSHEIPGGSHPAYLDDPRRWHALLYNFLQLLNAPPSA